MIEEILVGKQRIRYSRHMNQVHVDMDWDRLAVGNTLVVKAYKVIDPDTFTDVWKDRWLLRYAACLIKIQWGSNLTKFEGMQLPGGVQFNGQKIYDDAIAERQQLEEEMATAYSYPPEDFVG